MAFSLALAFVGGSEAFSLAEACLVWACLAVDPDSVAFLDEPQAFWMLRGMLALLRGSGLQLFAAFRKFLFLLLLLFGLVEPGEAVLSDYVAIFSCRNFFRIEFEGIDLHALLIERDNFKSSPCIDGDKIGRNVAVG